jgi:hypothetical protein
MGSCLNSVAIHPEPVAVKATSIPPVVGESEEEPEMPKIDRMFAGHKKRERRQQQQDA